MKVLAWVEKAGKKVIDIVEHIPGAAVTIVKVLTTGKEAVQPIKDGIALLFDDAEKLAISAGPAIASEGENPMLDEASIALAIKLAKDFLAFVPVLEKYGKELFVDVKQAPPVPVAAAGSLAAQAQVTK